MKANLWKLMALLVVISLVLAACQPSTPEAPEETEAPPEETEAPPEETEAPPEETEAPPEEPCLIVGAIYVGTVDDAGYNRAQHDGLVAMQENIPCVEILEAENVPEGADAERPLETMIQQGAGLIFATSFGHLEAALNVAEGHPDVVFMHSGGYLDPLPENVGSYYANMPETMYLMGIAAAHTTETGKLGFVAAMPIGWTLANINAFALGAQSVNPDIVTHAVFTGSWVDRAAEASAVQALAEEGVDVVTMHVDSPITILQAAEEAGIYSIGFQSVTAQEYAPNGWITGLGFNWGPVMTETAQQVIDGTWEPQNIRKGIYDNYMVVAPFGDFVPQEVQDEVLGPIEELGTGELNVFAGPLYDQEGNELVADGDAIPGWALGDIDWFVQGVIGEPPQW
jgi:basic membrane protein A